MSISGIGDNDIVLDFFAGSGSTGHAALEFAAETGQKIPFICVQLPEKTGEDSEEYRHGYKTISAIGIERIKRVQKRVRDNNQLVPIDSGVKIYRLNKSNFKLWQSPDKQITDADLIKQMGLAVDHINPNATQEDLLYELLIKSGVKPTESITTIELAGHKVFSVAEGSLLVHLEDNIDKALIDAVMAQKPVHFICLDKAFHGNDQLKANAVKTFETFNQGLGKDEVSIGFRTV